jgi:glycosyltransferase involved in cell wall biosynthesis
MLSPQLKNICRIISWPVRFGILSAFRKYRTLLRIFYGSVSFDSEYYQYVYPEVLHIHHEDEILENPLLLQIAPTGIHPAVRYVESGIISGAIPFHPHPVRLRSHAVWKGSLSSALEFVSHQPTFIETVEPQNQRGHLRCSVIIPTFNRCQVIIAAIQSALEQSVKPSEVLICDDGSIDDTEERIEEYFSQEIRQGLIRYFKIAHSGAAIARNFLLERATGDVIAYLDSDVRWQQNHLAYALGVFENDPHTQHLFICARPRPNGAPKGFNLDRTWLLQKNFVDLNTYVHRSDLYKALGGFDVKLMRLIDYDLILRYGLHSPLKRIPFDTVKYRLSEDSITRTQPLGPALARIRRNHRIERIALFLEIRPIAVIGGAHRKCEINDAEILRQQGYSVTEFSDFGCGTDLEFHEWSRYSLLYFTAPQPSTWKTLSNAPTIKSPAIAVRCDTEFVNNLIDGLHDGSIVVKNWDQIYLLTASQTESVKLRAENVPTTSILCQNLVEKNSINNRVNNNKNIYQND